MVKGNPRDGWVKVGLIADLSLFISSECEDASTELKTVWEENWHTIENDQKATNKLIKKIDKVKRITRNVLKELY